MSEASSSPYSYFYLLPISLTISEPESVNFRCSRTVNIFSIFKQPLTMSLRPSISRSMKFPLVSAALPKSLKTYSMSEVCSAELSAIFLTQNLRNISFSAPIDSIFLFQSLIFIWASFSSLRTFCNEFSNTLRFSVTCVCSRSKACLLFSCLSILSFA